MTVQILNPDPLSIQRVVKLLHNQSPVAIPTETVYGLAANACDDQAVAQIYALKSRPQFNPLIIHCESLEQAQRYGTFNKQAITLANAFWPGPLTIVLPYNPSSGISELARAGLSTIALRVPAHPITQNILKESSMPLAAPSANPSEQVSPTSAEAVALGFKDSAHEIFVINGGPCSVGLESTIIDLTTNTPTILRPGYITPEDLKKVLGVLPAFANPHKDTGPKAPGMLKRHYAPHHLLRMGVTDPMDHDGFLSFGSGLPSTQNTLNLSPSGDLREAAANLFDYLKRLDGMNIQSIAVAPIPNEGIGIAINDRLSRAVSRSQEGNQDER